MNSEKYIGISKGFRSYPQQAPTCSLPLTALFSQEIVQKFPDGMRWSG
jgi:hypothetical protein